MRARIRPLIAAVLCALALAACSVDATVTVRLHEDGSGEVIARVVLDAAAVEAAEIGGGKLEDRVRLGDLPAAGWEVSPWTRPRDGGAVVTVRKSFDRPEQVAGIVRELAGELGPLKGVHASRDASTFSTSWHVRGAVDLRKLDAGVATDPELVARLAGERIDVPQVEQRIDEAARGLRVHLVAELPGETRSAAAGAGHRAVLVANADATAYGKVLLLVGGIALVVLAVVLLVVGERRARRRRTSIQSGA